MDELFLMAGKLKAAGTPGSVREIYKKLQDNPPKATWTAAPAVKADFMALVIDYKERTGKTYKESYLKIRKENPDVFDSWLESVQA